MLRHCPILGRASTNTSTSFSRGKWTLVQCAETGFVYLPDPPSYDALAGEHAWESTFAAERARRRREEPVVSAVGGWIKRARRRVFRARNPFADIVGARLARDGATPPYRIVHVGCSHAAFTRSIAERLGARGLRVAMTGIEVSPALAAAARETLAPIGGTVVEASALEGVRSLEPASVTAVLMSSFLEHEAQPLELLREVRRSLRIGGFAVVKVPNFASWNRVVRGARWCGFRYPDHVNYFTPRTLQALAERADLCFEQGWLDRLPLSDNMYAVLSRAPQG
jgi:SAM-dependent methyltransferase